MYFFYAGNFLDPEKDLFDHKDDNNGNNVKFSLRKPSHPEDDLCYIYPGKAESLAACTFNSTSKTFLVIHGWTVSRKQPVETCLPSLPQGFCLLCTTLETGGAIFDQNLVLSCLTGYITDKQ